MRKIIKVFLIVVILNIVSIDENFCDGFMDIKDFGSELSGISTLHEIELEKGDITKDLFVSKMKSLGFNISKPNENSIKGDMDGGEFFVFLGHGNMLGKMRITSDTLDLYYRVIKCVRAIQGISVADLDANVKYFLKENIDKTAEEIMRKMGKREMSCNIVKLNRGYEIIVSKFDRLFKPGTRTGNFILMEYGSKSYIIFGEKEIFMDY